LSITPTPTIPSFPNLVTDMIAAKPLPQRHPRL
jgi:hypothetical protein